MIRFNDDYITRVQEIIKAKNDDAAREILADLHPADIAELYEELNLDEAEYLYRLLDPEVGAEVLAELDDDDRKTLLSHLPNDVIAQQFLQNLDTDDAVDIIRDLDEEAQEDILSHMHDIEQAGDIVDLLKYDEDTAGGLMGTEMIVVNENWSMPECIKEMRNQAEEMEEIDYVYGVEDEERLVGSLPLKRRNTSPWV